MTKYKSKAGRNKGTQAKDIMSTKLVVLSPEDTFRTAVEKLVENRLIVLPVVDSSGRLLGILSEKNILAQCKSFDITVPNFLDRKIKYSRSVRTIGLSTSIDVLGASLAENKFRHLLVLDKNKVLKGIISRRDLIRIIYLRLEVKKQSRSL